MPAFRHGKKLLGAVAVATVISAGGATIAFAATTPASPKVITGCYSTHTGALRVVKSAGDCKRGEHAITWNKQGVAGHSVRHYAGLPKNSLGNNGDFFVDTAHHVFYGPKANGRWPAHGTSLVGPTGTKGATGPVGPQGLVGATGATGVTGAAGTNGTNGKTILSGYGDPQDTQGADGDFYLDLAHYALWGPKAGGSWNGTPVTGLKGPQGPQGPQGPAGTNGTNGTDGAQGPSGFTGYQVVTASTPYSHTAGGTNQYYADAHCPGNKVLVGGGAFKTQDTGEITADGPFFSGGTMYQIWEARVLIRSDEGSASDTLYAVAFCADPS